MPPPAPESLLDRVLILAPTGRDAALAARVLAQDGPFPSNVVTGVEELCREIALGAGLAIIAEEALSRAALDTLGRAFAHQEAWSDLPLLVLTGADTALRLREPRADVLADLGNVTFIERPVRTRELLSAVRAALRARRRQYEVRELLAELATAVRSRDQFLAMLGHELRNPLGAISYAVQLLERGGAPDAMERHRRIIERQSRNLSRLVDDLLDVARVTSGKVVLQRQDLDLRDVVSRCLQSQDEAIRAQRLTVTTALGRDPIPVSGDPVRLDQVLTNLLENAVKYTPSGGSVDVSAHIADGRAVLRVRDTGMGISADILPRVFEPFTQDDRTLDRSRGGMGLGLTLVRTLVELHGGTVAVRSAGPGKGTTFEVALPLVLATPASHEPPRVPEDPRRARRRVLVVEDNADIREALQLLLEDAGHDVRCAHTGPEGVAIALEWQPEVAVVDIGLPELDGYELARRVRSALQSRIALIALTGYGQPEDRRRAFAAGFDLHLTKPIAADEVERLVSAVFGPLLRVSRSP